MRRGAPPVASGWNRNEVEPQMGRRGDQMDWSEATAA